MTLIRRRWLIACAVIGLLLAACEEGSRDDSGPRSLFSASLDVQGGSVELGILPDEVVEGSNPDHILVNNTDNRIGYGHAYVLQRRNEEGWKRLPKTQNCAFTLELIELRSGGRGTPEVVGGCNARGETEPLERGEYRLTKQVELASGKRLAIRVVFVVRAET